jgi:hypothetical protein
MYLRFNTHGLLCGGYLGEPNDFTWTYDDFEEHLKEYVTPSMYRFMAEYVRENISDEDLRAMKLDEYRPGYLEEDAVDAYFSLPINRRIALHEQMLDELRNEKHIAEAKERAAIEIISCANDSPIRHEYNDFIRRLVNENRTKSDRLDRQIREEEQWRGGHEEGAEDFV